MFRLHETRSVLDCYWYNEVFVWTVCLIVTYCINTTGLIHIMMALVCLQHFRSPEISNKSTNRTIFRSSTRVFQKVRFPIFLPPKYFT